jgi:hypothetical protein
MKCDGILSYTILSVPVFMKKQRRLERATVAARGHIADFFERVSDDDPHIVYSLLIADR